MKVDCWSNLFFVCVFFFQTKLHGICEEVGRRLQNFMALDSLNNRLASPTLSVSSEAFIDILDHLDQSIEYIRNHVSDTLLWHVLNIFDNWKYVLLYSSHINCISIIILAFFITSPLFHNILLLVIPNILKVWGFETVTPSPIFKYCFWVYFPCWCILACFQLCKIFMLWYNYFNFKVFTGDENCCFVRARGGNQAHTLPGFATASLVLWPWYVVT